MNPTKTLLAVITVFTVLASCNSNTTATTKDSGVDSVATNIKNYSHVWDEIVNNRRLDFFNDTNFTKDIVMHGDPADIVGIDSARAFYANYINGFSEVTFTIKDIFGMGNKLVKHWNFKGKHTGTFFGIPPTGHSIDIDGVTLVRMEGGRIAEERDFLDNMDFMQQLGLLPKE